MLCHSCQIVPTALFTYEVYTEGRANPPDRTIKYIPSSFIAMVSGFKAASVNQQLVCIACLWSSSRLVLNWDSRLATIQPPNWLHHCVLFALIATRVPVYRRARINLTFYSDHSFHESIAHFLNKTAQVWLHQYFVSFSLYFVACLALRETLMVR